MQKELRGKPIALAINRVTNTLVKKYDLCQIGRASCRERV